MAEEMKAGTILIREKALLPDSLRLESEPYLNGWRVVKHRDDVRLERRIKDAGWNFFYMAGEIKATVFGAEGETTKRKAVKRILAKLEAEKFNSLEITEVASNRFLGVPRVSVSAHWRQVQESLVLFRSDRVAESDRTKLVAEKIAA